MDKVSDLIQWANPLISRIHAAHGKIEWMSVSGSGYVTIFGHRLAGEMPRRRVEPGRLSENEVRAVLRGIGFGEAHYSYGYEYQHPHAGWSFTPAYSMPLSYDSANTVIVEAPADTVYVTPVPEPHVPLPVGVSADYGTADYLRDMGDWLPSHFVMPDGTILAADFGPFVELRGRGRRDWLGTFSASSAKPDIPSVRRDTHWQRGDLGAVTYGDCAERVWPCAIAGELRAQLRAARGATKCLAALKFAGYGDVVTSLGLPSAPILGDEAAIKKAILDEYVSPMDGVHDYEELAQLFTGQRLPIREWYISRNGPPRRPNRLGIVEPTDCWLYREPHPMDWPEEVFVGRLLGLHA